MPDDKYEKYIGRPRTEKINKEVIKQMSNHALHAGEHVKTGGDSPYSPVDIQVNDQGKNEHDIYADSAFGSDKEDSKAAVGIKKQKSIRSIT
jgi:hypothetical protein